MLFAPTGLGGIVFILTAAALAARRGNPQIRRAGVEVHGELLRRGANCDLAGPGDAILLVSKLEAARTRSVCPDRMMLAALLGSSGTLEKPPWSDVRNGIGDVVLMLAV